MTRLNLVLAEGYPGIVFWERETSNGTTHLIPMKDGIPDVSNFVRVPPASVIRPSQEVAVGYGNDRPPVSIFKAYDNERSRR